MSNFFNDLFKEVVTFQTKTGMSDTALGLKFSNDSHLILKLRRIDKHIGINDTDRLLEWMKSYKPKKKPLSAKAKPERVGA